MEYVRKARYNQYQLTQLVASSTSMMGNSENTCFKESRINHFETKSELVSSNSEREIDFVGQFLQIQRSLAQNEVEVKNSIEFASVSVSNLPSSPQSSEVNSENSEENKKTKSIFHNFQKHLVTTLKINISINKTNTKNDPTVHLAQRMWKIFQRSNYFSKRILHFLFGVSSSLRQPPPPKANNDIFQGFNEIASIYPTYEIELAQEYLRQQVVRQGKRLLSKNLLSHRRMQKGEEFQSYFSKFLQEIENGAMSKRLPKSSKLKLLNTLGKIKQQQA